MVVLVVAGISAGCALSGAGTTTLRSRAHRHVVSAPVAMARTPVWALDACAAAEQLRGDCPTLVPATARQGTTMFFDVATRRDPVSVLQLETGLAYGGPQERGHRPPILSNVVVVGGGFLAVDRSGFPSPSEVVHPIKGAIGRGYRTTPTALGPRHWAGLSGQLSLTPTIYAHSGELSDLTVFRWHDARGDHAVGVNVWQPLSQSVGTLRAIIASLRPQSRPPPTSIVRLVDGIPMTTAPSWMHHICTRSILTRPACPTILPKADAQSVYVVLAPTPAQGSPISFQISVEWFGDMASQRNLHPPRFGHIEISEGHIAAASRDAAPIPLDRIRIPSGYRATLPIPLGHPRWTREPGLLIFGDCFGNHLCYRWHGAGHHYQIDLHAWYPLSHTANVLRAIVRSTPAAQHP
jgi:hypothetical protein